MERLTIEEFYQKLENYIKTISDSKKKREFEGYLKYLRTFNDIYYRIFRHKNKKRFIIQKPEVLVNPKFGNVNFSYVVKNEIQTIKLFFTNQPLLIFQPELKVKFENSDEPIKPDFIFVDRINRVFWISEIKNQTFSFPKQTTKTKYKSELNHFLEKEQTYRYQIAFYTLGLILFKQQERLPFSIIGSLIKYNIVNSICFTYTIEEPKQPFNVWKVLEFDINKRFIKSFFN